MRLSCGSRSKKTLRRPLYVARYTGVPATMIWARVAVSRAAISAGAVARPKSASAGSVARSTSSVTAPSAASRASAYSTSIRDLDELDGLPEIPTAAGPRLESFTSARSRCTRRPASPWRRPGGVASLWRRDATGSRPPSPAALAERPRARGCEPRPARGRPVLRLERVRDPAALLARERDRGGVQRLAHARRTAAERRDVGGEAVHDPVLHVPLRDVRHRPRDLRAHAVRGRVCGPRIPHADDLLARGSGRRDRPGSLGTRVEPRGIVRVQLHRHRGIQVGARSGTDVPSLRSGDGAPRRDPGRRLPRRYTRLTAHAARPARRPEDRAGLVRASAGARRDGRNPRARSPRPGLGDRPARRV